MSVEPLNASITGTEPFARTLVRNGKILTRGETVTLQVNLGYLCNQVCRHCHLEAGPNRTEVMDRQTAGATADYAARAGFQTVDVTGGAPELNPNLARLLGRLVRSARRVMLRANLTALGLPEQRDLVRLLADLGVVVVASFPSLSPAQADGQRGAGVFARSIAAMKTLVELGYGRPGSGLELNLVSNPAGAFLPPGQAATEKRFRERLKAQFGLEFNNLFTFANVPLGRFRRWLEKGGNYEGYLARLVEAFNPCAVDGVMCRAQVSVSWDGYLYDCDFNLAAGLPLGGNKIHVVELDAPPPSGSPIAVGDHCYACTAGSGFT